jgi:hypothetical protein
VTAADGLVLIDQIISSPVSDEIALSSYTVRMQTAVEENLRTMAAGDHSGVADFASTITTGDGLSIPVVTVAVPAPAERALTRRCSPRSGAWSYSPRRRGPAAQQRFRIARWQLPIDWKTLKG